MVAVYYLSTPKVFSILEIVTALSYSHLGVAPLGEGYIIKILSTFLTENQLRMAQPSHLLAVDKTEFSTEK